MVACLSKGVAWFLGLTMPLLEFFSFFFFMASSPGPQTQTISQQLWKWRVCISTVTSCALCWMQGCSSLAQHCCLLWHIFKVSKFAWKLVVCGEALVGVGAIVLLGKTRALAGPKWWPSYPRSLVLCGQYWSLHVLFQVCTCFLCAADLEGWKMLDEDSEDLACGSFPCSCVLNVRKFECSAQRSR